jgi:hypothetical protein
VADGAKPAADARFNLEVDMLRKINKRRLAIIILIVLVLEVSASQSGREGEPQNAAPDSLRLSAEDKAELSEVLRLQLALGDQVWAGLSQARIPVILYDDGYEFLVGKPDPPAPWAVVEGDNFNGKPYYRRNASHPQAFAVEIGEGWAGSLSTLEHMNRKSLMKLSRDFHVALILHEMFHAYQATQSSQRFKQALKLYAVEARYPSKESEFAASWDKEGSLLAAALKATDEATTRRVIGDFLEVRDSRRAQSALSADLIAYEREMEWLEGLAKYIEMRFYEIAASRAGDPLYASYRPGLPYWRTNFVLLERRLGHQGGDLRFYLSGMAQARLLDSLRPGWQAKVMRSGVYLEDLLRGAVELKPK